MILTGDAILRRIERTYCKGQVDNRIVCCLPGAKSRDITLRLAMLLSQSMGKDPLVMVYIGTNDIVIRYFTDN